MAHYCGVNAPGSRAISIQYWLNTYCSRQFNSPPLYKMAAISRTIVSDAFSKMKNLCISLKFVPKGPIDNNVASI